MSISTADILGMLTEDVILRGATQSGPRTQVSVDYYATTQTPKGSHTRFQRTIGYNQFRGGVGSDFAVQAYLRKRHPGCVIELMNVVWK